MRDHGASGGLIYNWWSLFLRLTIPERHAQAITNRPLLLHAIARLTRHAGPWSPGRRGVRSDK